MEGIKLVLPKAHQHVEITPGIEQEMKDVQRELADKGDRLPSGKIHFIISKGFYKQDKKVLTIASVIVNKLEADINALKMTLKFALKHNPDAKFAPMNAFLDEEFLGVLENNQAFILHMDVPAENAGDQDAIFQPNEIMGRMEDIEYRYITQ